MIATILSESDGYTEAYNLNKDDAGNILSKDVGLCQINIPIDKIGTYYEKNLFVPENNILYAWNLYKTRGFQPWYGYTKGVATDPSWWRFSEKYQEWRPAGRRIHKAIRGVANFWAEEFAVESPKDILLDFRAVPRKPKTRPNS